MIDARKIDGIIHSSFVRYRYTRLKWKVEKMKNEGPVVFMHISVSSSHRHRHQPPVYIYSSMYQEKEKERKTDEPSCIGLYYTMSSKKSFVEYVVFMLFIE